MAPARTRLNALGLQLYTVRDLMQGSVPRTLEQVAAVGYREVEFAGYFDHPARTLRRWLDQAELTAPSGHLPLDNPRLDLSATLDAAAELGHKYLILASLPSEKRATIDGFRWAARRLNEVGGLAQNRGMRVAYHNHDFEFVPLGGKLPYRILLDETDPGLVAMEVDVYWMTKAGEDPLAYFHNYPGRFHLCHLKDMDLKGGITDVGSGRIDFPKILAARAQAGLQYFFVEHDSPRDPKQSIRTSYHYLRGLP